MHYEVLEQLTRDRRTALRREADEARLVAATSVRRRPVQRVVSAAVALLHSRQSAAKVETQA